MFFGRSISIIFITRGKIKAAVFSPEGKIKKGVENHNWTAESLTETLRQISARKPARVRIVFGEEFSYVTAVPFKKDKREEVLRQAQEKFPEPLDTNWDFKKERSTETELQVAAVKKEILNIFERGLREANFKIESAEPQSVALARLLPEKGFFLFIACDEKVLLGAINDGTVEVACVSSKKEILGDLKEFVVFVRKKFGRDPEKIFVGQEINPDSEVLRGHNIPTEAFNLDPLFGAFLKKNIVGEDLAVLNVGPEKNISARKEKKAAFRQISSREKILIGIFLLIFISTVVAIISKS